MTAPRPDDRRSLLAVAWWGSALTAAFALIGLVVISGGPGSPRLALRADSYNQMTGIGSTSSAVTVNWTSGLLDATNTPITAATTTTDGTSELNPNSDRATGIGTLSFYDNDFKSLQVTVSQTENITHQGITVSWTGAAASTSGENFNFLQMMECYGDSAAGPSPEGCEYGSQNMLGTQIGNQQITTRTGTMCAANSTPSASAPPSGFEGGPPSGCDAFEPAAETPAHCDPSATGNAACSGGEFSIPFVPVDDATNPLYGQGPAGTPTLFNQFNTNEVQAAFTGSDGTGQHQFESLTAAQAPGLGCGEAETSGQTRNCWLVIVPRGTFEPNGFHVTTPAVPLFTSPLSASNWAQRIQIHLGYAPMTANCPPTVIPDAMAGSQVIFRAVTSWQSALNLAAKCAKVYSYTAKTENEATNDLLNGQDGLAFTTIPIGSEVTRAGETAPTLPTILYAPVAVTALGLGFNVNAGQAGQLATAVKLTPSLLARALTQVYPLDLPDFVGDLKGPTWVQQNPQSLLADPSFTALNKELPNSINGLPTFPLITGDHSADNQRFWQWIQSDPGTATWLDGGTDPNNPVTADPDFVSLNLGKPPATDQFDEAYTGTVTCGQIYGATSGTCTGAAGNSLADVSLDSEDLLPVMTNFDQAAATVLAATDPALDKVFSTTNKAPSGIPGFWNTVGTEQPGQTFMWTVNDMPDLAAYGLVSAALCDPTGANCIQPSTADVTTALSSAAPDSAGLLQVNPATVPAGGYPLVDVVYAAVPTNQSAALLADYASFISYAAGQGQVTGTAPGDLPPGYLPLTASLQAQAQSVVTQLQTLAGVTASPSASPTGSASPTVSATTTTGGSTDTGGTTGGTTTGGTTGGTTSGGTTSGGTTTGGTTTGGTTTGGTTGGTTTTGGSTTTGRTTGGTPTTGGTATRSAATATCTPAATASASPSRTAAGTAAAASSGCASATVPPFVVLPPAAQAIAGTTQPTTVGSVRNVLIIVLCIGAAGALAGGLLYYGGAPGRGRSRERPDGP